MTCRLLISTLLLLTGIVCGAAGEEKPSPAVSGSPMPSESISRSRKLAPFKERLATAKSVRVQTNILGIELDSPLEQAQEKLRSLGDVKSPIQKKDETEGGEEGHKVLWQLAKSDFKSVYVKTDKEERITYIMGLLREGKEVPFDKIGQIEKAPILTNTTVAWDIVKPNRTLIRVVASGQDRKASSITIFIVKRPPRP